MKPSILEEQSLSYLTNENNNVLLDNLLNYLLRKRKFCKSRNLGRKDFYNRALIFLPANTYVYARFQSQYGCYSIAPINLLFVSQLKQLIQKLLFVIII